MSLSIGNSTEGVRISIYWVGLADLWNPIEILTAPLYKSLLLSRSSDITYTSTVTVKTSGEQRSQHKACINGSAL